MPIEVRFRIAFSIIIQSQSGSFQLLLTGVKLIDPLLK